MTTYELMKFIKNVGDHKFNGWKGDKKLRQIYKIAEWYLDKYTYRWQDGWLLASINIANMQKPATIKQIIRAGDFLNHAVFNQDELENGLERLQAGGWIAAKKTKFVVTQKFKDIKWQHPPTLENVYNHIRSTQ